MDMEKRGLIEEAVSSHSSLSVLNSHHGPFLTTPAAAIAYPDPNFSERIADIII